MKTFTIQTAEETMRISSAEAAQHLEAYNDAIDRNDIQTAETEKDAVSDAVSKFNSASREHFKLTMLDGPDAMLRICVERNYATLRAAKEAGESEVAPHLTIIPVDKPFDIIGGLTKKEFAKASAEANALPLIEALTKAYTKDIAGGVGYDAERWESEIGKVFKISKDGKALNIKVSNTALKKALQAVVAAMIGDGYSERIIGADLRFFREAFSKYNKTNAGTIHAANLKSVGFILMDICQRVATGGFYSVQTKQVEKEK